MYSRESRIIQLCCNIYHLLWYIGRASILGLIFKGLYQRTNANFSYFSISQISLVHYLNGIKSWRWSSFFTNFEIFKLSLRPLFHLGLWLDFVMTPTTITLWIILNYLNQLQSFKHLLCYLKYMTDSSWLLLVNFSSIYSSFLKKSLKFWRKCVDRSLKADINYPILWLLPIS